MNTSKKIIQQIIASTHEDSHGERASKKFLDSMCATYARKRMPLHQQHDMSKDTVGYCENFNVTHDPETGEHYLKADVYFTCETIDEAMRGFSWSCVEGITENYDTSEYRICLPFPFYNNQELLSEISISDANIGIGAWRKKALDPTIVGLLFSGVCFAFGPMWTNYYNDNLVPNIKKLLKQYEKLEKQGLTADFIQPIVGNLNEEFGVHFIPDRGKEIESFNPESIKNGLLGVEKFLKEDTKSQTVGIYRIKTLYNRELNKYVIFHVEYLDGTDVNIV